MEEIFAMSFSIAVLAIRAIQNSNAPPIYLIYIITYLITYFISYDKGKYIFLRPVESCFFIETQRDSFCNDNGSNHIFPDFGN